MSGTKKMSSQKQRQALMLLPQYIHTHPNFNENNLIKSILRQLSYYIIITFKLNFMAIKHLQLSVQIR